MTSLGAVLKPEPARPADACALLRLRDSAALWMLQHRVQQWKPGEVPLTSFDKQVAAGEWHVLRADDRTIYAGLRLLWSDETTWGPVEPIAGYVHGLVVARDSASQGLGAGLLRWAGQQTLNQGRILLRLDCVETNLDLRRYYLDQGFHEVGHRDFNSARWSPVVLLERQLQGRNGAATNDRR